MTNLLPYFRNPAPKKDREVSREGFRGYVNLYLTYFWQLLFVNLVFLLACLPVVTIPAAFTALNRVCIKLIHDRYALVWLEFRDEFCRSFGRSLKIGLTLLPVFFLSYYLLSLGLTNGGNAYGMLFSGAGLLLGLLALAVFQYAFVLNASLDLPAWAILKNSRALTFLGLKYTIGILGITCFVDVAMLFGFPISLLLLVLGVPALVQFIVCCLGNIPMQKWIVEPYLRQQEEKTGM